MRTRQAVILILLLATFCAAQTASSLPADSRQAIDRAAQEVLATTGVPSASIAVVKDGKIAYLRAYGDAKLEPRVAATPQMRYSVGSISKQFTATAILMLSEEGRLSLDDPVSRWVPGLTRGHEVTVRQLLSHTAGYQDYWPQDYVFPLMLQPISAQGILDRWARKPLDFEPGTKYQYSNTGFVVAGLIIEKASGQPMVQFLTERVFRPLNMTSVLNVDQERLTEADPVGYLRYAVGPLHVAPKEGKGWLFAVGELAMTPEDLAKWDIAMIEQKLLKPASYRQQQADTLLKNGLPTHYGLGIGVGEQNGHRTLSHDGGASGFTTQNVIFPDDRVAVVVFTNLASGAASDALAKRIAPLLFSTDNAQRERDHGEARTIFEGLQRGTIERTRFTEDANAYFTEEALRDYGSSLGPLGPPQEFSQDGNTGWRGGMTEQVYHLRFANGKKVWVVLRAMPDGKIEQYQVSASD